MSSTSSIKRILEPHDARIRVECSSVDFIPAHKRAEFDPNCHLLLYDVAGYVEEIGNCVESLKVGDRVAGIVIREDVENETETGDEYDFVKLPDTVSCVEAAACLGDAFKAYVALHYCCGGGVKKGDKIMVVNGATSPSIACIQLARAIGAEVTATYATSEEKARLERFIIEFREDEMIDIVEFSKQSIVRAYEMNTKELGFAAIVDISHLTKYDNGNAKITSFLDMAEYIGIRGKLVTRDPFLHVTPSDSQRLFLRGGSLNFVNEKSILMGGTCVGRFQHILKDVVGKLREKKIKPFGLSIVSPEEAKKGNDDDGENMGKVVTVRSQGGKH